MQQQTEIILASASKTRLQMLLRAGVEVISKPATVDEQSIKTSLITEGLGARDVADCLADAKARSIAQSYPHGLVIGADQILSCDGTLLSKAKSRTDAVKTLNVLSGKTHQLLSAAVIYDHGQPVWRGVTTAHMTVRPLSAAFIESYLDQLGDDAFWSVGAYQLEGLGAQLFEKVEGDYFTILGLPLLPMLDFLRRRGCIAT